MATERVCDKCGEPIIGDDYIEDFWGGTVCTACFDAVAVVDEDEEADRG